jgi:formate dehydrogenase (NADP+) beta subunit
LSVSHTLLFLYADVTKHLHPQDMEVTDVNDPEYYHKVVDCQYACPAHTPVPEYIRLIAAGKFTEAYMVNWESNVFPGVLGRTCDRPCEPACRRGRVDEEPVAICRLKRVAADNKGDIAHLMPDIPSVKNGKTIGIVGAGPASLTVARDLAPLGYEIHIYDENPTGGGMMRTQIPSFRLPARVLDQEVDQILNLGIVTHFNKRVNSMSEMLGQGYDVVFVGTGAPKGRDLAIAGREECRANIHIGIEWLSSVAFEHTDKIGRRVIVLGGGNTAMDCCRTARRLGGAEVKVIVRSPFDEMKASPWEKEDAMHEDIPIVDNHVPKRFEIEDGRLIGMFFDKVEPQMIDGKRKLVPTGEPEVFVACDDVLIAIGQENTFPWIERNIGIAFDEWGMPMVDSQTFVSTNPKVFFGGDAALGPKNIITAVAQGHEAAVSIDLYLRGESIKNRPAPQTRLFSTKMGMHEWAFDNQVSSDDRFIVPQAEKALTLANRKVEVELGFDTKVGYHEAQRCLNCDIQTIFTDNKCIECDACMDICPTSCINFTENEEDEAALRQKLLVPAHNLFQDILVSGPLKTGRVMVKDEDLCLHCGLCAERCPTAAWDMQKFLYNTAKAGHLCTV